jgi:hypothetical protein
LTAIRRMASDVSWFNVRPSIFTNHIVTQQCANLYGKLWTS